MYNEVYEVGAKMVTIRGKKSSLEKGLSWLGGGASELRKRLVSVKAFLSRDGGNTIKA